MRVWIDIDNAPQVQYLLPITRPFRDRGDDVVLTARDHGITFELLEQLGVTFVPLGSSFGRSRIAKTRGLASRSVALWSTVRKHGRPDVLISSSRSSAIVAKALNIPAFVLCDYEHVDLRIYRSCGSVILYPSVIPAQAFLDQGFSRGRLIGFPGLKEDLSFAFHDPEAVQPYDFGERAIGRMVAVFRPPAAESHYHSQSSSKVAMDAMRWFARRSDIVVVFSPRYRWQIEMLESCTWNTIPVVLERPVPFLEVLKGADVVVSAGGTMLREAACLGVQAVSIFRGKLGAVDAHLARIGRLNLVETADDLDAIQFGKVREPFARRPTLPAELVDLVESYMREHARRVV